MPRRRWSGVPGRPLPRNPRDHGGARMVFRGCRPRAPIHQRRRGLGCCDFCGSAARVLWRALSVWLRRAARHSAPFCRGLGAGRARRACCKTRCGFALLPNGGGSFASAHGLGRIWSLSCRPRLGRQALVFILRPRRGSGDLGRRGLPMLDRLFTAIDPSLRGFHELRSPFLFPSHWPIESFPPLIVQATTIAIAAHFQQGRGRRILAAIILVWFGRHSHCRDFWRLAFLASYCAGAALAHGLAHVCCRGDGLGSLRH